MGFAAMVGVLWAAHGLQHRTSAPAAAPLHGSRPGGLAMACLRLIRRA